jgi:hypothetical protein
VSEPIAKVLQGLQNFAESRRHILHIAVGILETEYKDRLLEDDMDIAYDFLEDELKATFFTGMQAGVGRDRWLERKAGVKLINWEVDCE